ncbi:MAG: cytochrome c-type biogenesis protein CcmH [Lautropia sp.]|nr:cytochrome c-type biogenesis protein CcmH [Lautropia sp.]
MRPAFPAISEAPDAEARLPDDDSLPTDADSIVRTPRFRQLAHELRCLVCQNQTLLDSNAPLAQDLRNEVIRLIASGRDDGQIKQYLVERYGEFVLYRPSWSWRNALLWFGPALMLLTAGLVGWRLTGGRRRSPPDAAHRTAAVRRNDGAGRDATGASAGTDASASSVSATAPTLHPVDGEDGKDDRDVLRDAETTRISSADEALKRVDALLAEEHDPPPAAEHR